MHAFLQFMFLLERMEQLEGGKEAELEGISITLHQPRSKIELAFPRNIR